MYLKTQKDLEYEKARNQLIPHAAKVADESCGVFPFGKGEEGRDQWNIDWSRIFHATMNRLAKENGLTTWP